MYVLARQPDLAAIFAGWIMATSFDELRTQINLGFMVVICLRHTEILQKFTLKIQPIIKCNIISPTQC